MRVRLKKGQGTASDPAGTWYAWQRHSERPIVDIVCPVCGKSFFLEKGDRSTASGVTKYEAHGIRARGEVFPSVICPFNCGFHTYVQLDGWDLGEMPEIIAH